MCMCVSERLRVCVHACVCVRETGRREESRTVVIAARFVAAFPLSTNSLMAVIRSELVNACTGSGMKTAPAMSATATSSIERGMVI